MLMKKLNKISVIITTILLTGIIVIPSVNSIIISNSKKELIDEYTWSVIKYTDWMKNQVNLENIRISKPTYGPLLVLADFMSPELCKVALEVYCENEDGSLNELETLYKLAKYAKESVIHIGNINYENNFDNFGTPTEDIFDNFKV